MEKVLIIDGEKCTGCRVCELACSMKRSGEYNPKHSSIKVLRNMEFDVSIPVLSRDCDFCGQCIEWCFESAIKFVDYEEAALIRKRAKVGCFPSPFVGSGL
ncbi:4Fe-4S dicluster domain-containing protein [Thermodesulfobacteriota bacterium]